MADQQKPGLLANILAVAGFIILIVIIVWGAYHLLRLTGSGVTSLFSRFGSGGDIAITVPDSVQTGRAFPVSWQYEAEEAGSYAFLYQCKSGFRFDIAQGGGTAAIPCGNAFTVGNNTSVTLTPVLSGTSTLEVPISVVFMPTSTTTTERPQGTATITVNTVAQPTTGTQQPSAQTPSTPPSTTQPTTATGDGTPDLTVKILAVGVIDAASGVFVQRAPSSPNDIAAVQFDIKNNGSANSGTYYFNVQLPTQPVYPFISGTQASLQPGAHVVSTLRFGPVAPSGGTISIEVDAARKVRDANRNNNVSAVWLNAPAYQYYYQAPFVY